MYIHIYSFYTFFYQDYNKIIIIKYSRSRLDVTWKHEYY